MNLTLNEAQYSTTGKLDVFTQLHIARKLGPAIAVVEGLVNPANADKDKSLISVMMLSQVPDQDVDFIMRKCLSVVVRRQGDSLAKIQSPNGQLMFDDIDLDALLTLTVAVLEESLGDFFRTSLARLTQEPKAPV